MRVDPDGTPSVRKQGWSDEPYGISEMSRAANAHDMMVPGEQDMGANGHLVLGSALMLSTAAVVLFFSLMGFGQNVYLALSSIGTWLAFVFLGVGGGVLFLLAALDAEHWTGVAQWAGYKLGLAISAGCVVCFCLLATGDYPYLPLLCSVCIPVTVVAGVRALALQRVRADSFFQALALWLALVSVALAAVFGVWVLGMPGWGTAAWEAEFGAESAANGTVLNMWQVSLYKMLFHLTYLVWEYIILSPPPHLQSLHYCNTISRSWRNIRRPADPPCVCHTP